jgi:fumarate reductase flavoprotein subunit
MHFDAEVDVLVVGGGGGGLVAALSARKGGAEVALVEKSRTLGGNTALSSGSVPGAGTRFQGEAGIEDSPALFAEDMMRRTAGTAPAHLVDRLASESAPLVEWLVDEMQVPLRLVPDLRKVGHSVARTHTPPGRHGSVLVDTLERRAAEEGVMISPGNALESLITDDGGSVRGVVVRSGSSTMRVGARRVILACNGFAGDRAMLKEFIPEVSAAPYFGHPDNTGDGIRAAVTLGAGLRNMGAYQGHASVSYPQGALMTWSAVERGGVLVNLAGERFVNEDFGYSGCASTVLAQPEAAAFVIFDTAIDEYLRANVPDYVEIDAYGGVRRGDIREIALANGINDAGLENSLAAYRKAAQGKAADEMGRERFGGAPLTPPFFSVRVTAGLFHTQGGLDIDADARVLRADGGVIGNLYAVGGTAVGVSGAHGGLGYCSANGLLAALGLGRVAGRHAAESL